MSRCLAWMTVLLLAAGARAGDPPDPAAAARSLLKRLLPERAGEFAFEPMPADAGRDVFEIESREGKVVIRGNRALSMATGLNWYLKHHARGHVSWYGNQLDLPRPLPAVAPAERHASWTQHRYFLNYCCFGYSLPWWDWAQWERLIDWMALNGIDLPLAVTGQEAVWQAVGKRLGMSDAQIAEFLAGPPYLPFQWMGCLDGHGGPLPADWVARHEELGRRILDRERELGMTPVLQGFTGHVPGAVTNLLPGARIQRIRWIEWETHLLDPLDPAFAKIAGLFLEEQAKRFGTDHFYAADTFIEMVPPSGDPKYLADLARAIHGGMAATDPQAVWVLQGWAFMNKRTFWTQPRFKAFLDAVPDDRMLILDLYCESTPMWDKTDAFCGKPWLWCNVQSFGRAVALGAALGRNNEGLHAARRDPKSGRLAGLGFVNEGLCYNPVAYDFLFEQAWRDGPVDRQAWIAGYARHRYGRAHAGAERAWRTLLETVLEVPARDRSALTAAPTLSRRSGRLPAGHERLGGAWDDLLGAAGELGAADTYRFDVVNLGRQVLADHAGALHADLRRAWLSKDPARFAGASARFLDLLRDVDELLATRREFLLGGWLEDAKRWGATPAERAKCAWNARRVLTLWGETPAIDDYAHKQWSGMLSGYYLPRWKAFLDAAAAALREGRPFDEAAAARERVARTARWAGEGGSFPAEPRGDSLEVARRLRGKYPDAPGLVPAALPVVSLTTGKPVACSAELRGHPAALANDGDRSDTDRYWATDVQRDPAAWWQVDLLATTKVGRVVVVGYYADERHYGFTVDVSTDGKQWERVADRRENTEPSTEDGYTCAFPQRAARYLRVTQTANSANTGRHLVEVMAYAE